jgi:hypothetical protein
MPMFYEDTLAEFKLQKQKATRTEEIDRYRENAPVEGERKRERGRGREREGEREGERERGRERERERGRERHFK